MTHTRVLIIGGGIVGCSIAYHLAQLGWTDVVVLEKGELTSGSTWHAAGLVGQLRSSRSVTRMLKYSAELYDRLEAETGQPTGWKRAGSLRLACTQERMMEIKKAATTAKSFGLEMHLLSASQAAELFPLMDTQGVLGAAFLPTDGYTDPSMTTQALSVGAKKLGVKFLRQTRVIDFTVTSQGEITEVITDQGTFKAEIVVNAAGMWARELGEKVGVNIPLIPVSHQYIITDLIANMPQNLPTLRDPDKLVYYKEEAGALVMGGYEPNPIPWSLKGIPANFSQELLEPNFDHFAPLAAFAMERTPILQKVGIKKLINGPESFTPDGHFIMGRAPELKNFFVAAGFNAHGIAAGGGAGKMMAEWIVHGEPSLDLWTVDIRRFGPYQRNVRYLRDRTLELYAKHYTIAWPHEEHKTARGIKRSPLYPLLQKQGAVFGAKFGWERANWFAPPGVFVSDSETFARANWFEPVGQEHESIRERVTLIDQTSFSKFEIKGPGATDFLQFLAVNDVDKPVGTLSYTQLCNEKGGIEADLTFARLASDHYYAVTGTAFTTRDFHWIKKHLPLDGSVVLSDVTSAKAVINVCGPLSRKLLQKISNTNLENEHFKFAQCRFIDLGYAEVLAMRVTYVGELGWELHMPMESAQYVYKLLWDAGQEFGISNAGYRAIESCRLEKGFRYWSTDLTPDYSPLAAGLGFCIKFSKENFIGKHALLEEKERGPEYRLATFVLDENPCLFGGETISCQGKVLGVLTSGGYGYTVKKTIAMGYIPRAYLDESRFTIESFGQEIKATRIDAPLYDSERKRILS